MDSRLCHHTNQNKRCVTVLPVSATLCYLHTAFCVPCAFAGGHVLMITSSTHCSSYPFFPFAPSVFESVVSTHHVFCPYHRSCSVITIILTHLRSFFSRGTNIIQIHFTMNLFSWIALSMQMSADPDHVKQDLTLNVSSVLQTMFVEKTPALIHCFVIFPGVLSPARIHIVCLILLTSSGTFPPEVTRSGPDSE